MLFKLPDDVQGHAHFAASQRSLQLSRNQCVVQPATQFRLPRGRCLINRLDFLFQ